MHSPMPWFCGTCLSAAAKKGVFAWRWISFTVDAVAAVAATAMALYTAYRNRDVADPYFRLFMLMGAAFSLVAFLDTIPFSCETDQPIEVGRPPSASGLLQFLCDLPILIRWGASLAANAPLRSSAGMRRFLPPLQR